MRDGLVEAGHLCGTRRTRIGEHRSASQIGKAQSTGRRRLVQHKRRRARSLLAKDADHVALAGHRRRLLRTTRTTRTVAPKAKPLAACFVIVVVVVVQKGPWRAATASVATDQHQDGHNQQQRASAHEEDPPFPVFRLVLGGLRKTSSSVCQRTILTAVVRRLRRRRRARRWRRNCWSANRRR